MMKVSVVIPVFNAAQFLERAVKSALAEGQTAEIIIVEDGSTDGSLVTCQELAAAHKQVILLRHENGINKGAAASRNLGMLNATQEYIALLDADDFFLPGRFEKAEKIFFANPDCDGVYGAVGIEFLDAKSEAQWLASPMRNVRVTTMTREIAPNDLLHALLGGKEGRFHIDGLTFKRCLLERSGLMNEKLVSMHEDTDFIFRLAIAGRLFPGELYLPIAVRFVHGSNRISANRTLAEQYEKRLKMHMETFRWCKHNGYEHEKVLLIHRMVADCFNSINTGGASKKGQAPKKILRMISWGGKYPEIFLEKEYWKEILVQFIPRNYQAASK